MKNYKNKKAELGQELADQRQAKGLTVEELSDITKISVKNIQNLEKGIFDFLPSAYVKAYLSSVARELGLNPEVVLKKYHASFVKDVDSDIIDSIDDKVPEKREKPKMETSPEPELMPALEPEPEEEIRINEEEGHELVQKPLTEEDETGPEPEMPPEPEEFIEPEPVQEPEPEIDDEIKEPENIPEPVQEQPAEPEPVIEEISALPEPEPVRRQAPPEPVIYEKQGWFQDFKLMLGFYSVFIYGFLAVAAIVTALIIFIPKLKSSEKPDRSQTVAVQDTVSMQSDMETETEPADNIMSLRMVVTDTTWLRIVYADSLVDEAIFVPGDERTWESGSDFWMRIGNASGVQLFLDEKDLGQPGSAGRITNIKVDANGIENVMKSQFPAKMNTQG